MAQVARQGEKKRVKELSWGAIVSVLLHAAVAIALLIHLPPYEPPAPEEESVSVELVPPPEEEPQPEEEPPPSDKPAMPSADAIYTVQVIWDETMAETSAKWLKANPAGRIIILAGNGHCHDSAIVGRMKRRGISDAISVRPVIDEGDGSVAELLAPSTEVTR